MSDKVDPYKAATRKVSDTPGSLHFFWVFLQVFCPGGGRLRRRPKAGLTGHEDTIFGGSPATKMTWHGGPFFLATRGSFHGHGHPTFGFILLYLWLSGCRAGVHTHTTGLEALSQSWLPSGDVGCRSLGAFTCLCLTSHMSTSRQLPWPRAPYVWVLTLIPVAQRLQGWRTYPYCRAGSPEPVLVALL